MKKAILVINAGSSSLKFALYADETSLVELVRGEIEGIGRASCFRVKGSVPTTVSENIQLDSGIAQTDALNIVIKWIESNFPQMTFAAIGHRVVHGGNQFLKPVLVNKEILHLLDKLDPLAPLHQPYNLAGIRVLSERYPNTHQIACFDTAFHSEWPDAAQRMALPRIYHDAGIRRYGFHGLSYEYLTNKLMLLVPTAQRVVLAHLGNGASVCAALNGKSIESSMGFSALDGLPMGTRCGSIDPAVIFHLHRQHGLAYDNIEQMLYKDSGLKGVSGLSSDMRDLLQSQTPAAQQAVELFVHHCVRYIGAMVAVLGGIDVLVFSGGIGRYAPTVRTVICERLGFFGIALDAQANSQNLDQISSDESAVSVFALKTDEEIVIARHCVNLLSLSS